MKLLVTGAKGLLGTEFVRIAERTGHAVAGLGRAELDVTDRRECIRKVAEVAPDVVVHCAAYTAVDRAEEEPEVVARVNVDGAGHVAEAAALAGSRVVYLSSDYVFGGTGDRPWRPDDPVAPQGVYAISKLSGERSTLGSLEPQACLIVRTGWLYGEGGRNFVDAIRSRAGAGLPLRVVDDQRGRPTWARNVAVVVLRLLELGAHGVWHVADGGDATWREFALGIVEATGCDVEVEGVSTEDWGAAAPRPRYSVLDVTATERLLGRSMMPWPRALAEYLGEVGTKTGGTQ